MVSSWLTMGTFVRGLARLRVRDTELMQDLAMEATGTITTGVGLESSESFGEFMAKMAMELWRIFVDLLCFFSKDDFPLPYCCSLPGSPNWAPCPLK